MASEIGEVREALMDTLRKLRKGEIKAADAKAVASVGQTVINSYTLQVRAINALGGEASAGLLKELGGETIDVPPTAAAPKRLSGAPSAGPGEGIHSVDPLLARPAEPAARRR